MKKKDTLKEHLDRIRKAGHEVLKKNGHFDRMAKRKKELAKKRIAKASKPQRA